MNKAVFLDRDGVINQEVGYAHLPSHLRIIKNSARAIQLLNNANFIVIIITNQAGIGKGVFTLTQMHLFNNLLLKRLDRYGSKIDMIYFCPHHPDALIPQFKKKCSCRKPNAKLIIKAAKEHNINLKTSFLIGDKATDIKAGKKAGIKTILVKTGYGRSELLNKIIDCDLIANDLYSAVKAILNYDSQK